MSLVDDYNKGKIDAVELNRQLNKQNEEQAKIFTDAIRKFASNEDALDNFQSYLSCHFDKCQFSIPRRSVNVQYVYQSLPVSKPSMNLPCHDNDRTRKYRLLSSF